MLPGDKLPRSGLTETELQEKILEAMGGIDDEALETYYEDSVSDFNTGRIVQGTVVNVLNDDMLVDIGFKEIEVGFPAASQIEFNLCAA